MTSKIITSSLGNRDVRTNEYSQTITDVVSRFIKKLATHKSTKDLDTKSYFDAIIKKSMKSGISKVSYKLLIKELRQQIKTINK